MSMQSLKAFWDRAAYDPALQARLRSVRGDTTELAIAEVVKIASEFGFSFTADEYLVGLPAVSPPPDREPEPRPPESSSDCCGCLMDC